MTWSVDATGVEHIIHNRGDDLLEPTEYKACDNENINSYNKGIGTSMCRECQKILDRMVAGKPCV